MAKALYLIPNGPKNLATLFPGVDFGDVAEYYVQTLDEDGEIIGTSTLNRTGCCCTGERVRVHFMNYLGTFDAINFSYHDAKIMHAVTSSEYQRPLKVPLEKTDSGTERFNVRSNELYEVKTNCYGEPQMDWCMEMLDSPKAFIEWTGIQGQDDQFLPIRIEDLKYEKKKTDERFNYELVLQFRFANEKIIIRN